MTRNKHPFIVRSEVGVCWATTSRILKRMMGDKLIEQDGSGRKDEV